MDEATNKSRQSLFSSEEIQKRNERLQQKSKIEIRPLIEELHENLATETRKTIKKTAQEATNDLHINQSKLASELEANIYQHTEMSKLNAEALRTDLQQQADTLESEFHDKHQYQSQAPRTQPATPERPAN